VTRSTSVIRLASISAAVCGPRPMARVAVVGQRVQMRPDGPAEERHQRPLAEPGHLADGGDAAVVQLRRRHRPHPPQALDG